MVVQSLGKVFYLSEDSFGKIREKPSVGFDQFPCTRLTVYALRLGDFGLKLESAVSSEENWHVDFIPCYTSRHFCFLARIDSVEIVSKDRAYQHGGGFALLLATPKDGGKETDQFTVFGVSPFEKKEALQWTRFFTYYKDMDLVFAQSNEAEIRTDRDRQFSHVFVAIPWELAEPLKPFLTGEIGLNFWAAQAIQAKIPVQFHMLLRSEKLIAEQSLRDYALYQLEKPPAPPNRLEIAFLLENRSLPLGTTGRLEVAANSPREERLSLKLLIDGIQVAETEPTASKGINRFTLEFGTRCLSAAKHLLQIDIRDDEAVFSKQVGIWTYDPSQFLEMKDEIYRLKKEKRLTGQRAESVSTLEYLLQTLDDGLSRLKPYSSFEVLQRIIDRIQRGISGLKVGRTLFARGEPLRMGFRSRQDQTLQPYSIYIPNSFKPNSSGLVILLHGSASDDVRMLSKPSVHEWSEKTGFIVVAPFARGESHFYLPKEASLEIVELTEKTMNLFSIPKEKVVLAGFSMGGFGVINTYFSRPDLYRNLMVISGGFKPHAREPDWSTDTALKELATTNLIIFHGDADLNVPYAEQKPVYEKLKRLNPNVRIVIARGVGHQEAPEWKVEIEDYLSKIGN